MSSAPQFTAEDFGQRPAQPKKPQKRPKGTLPYLPDRDADLTEWRNWLTNALAPPAGYSFAGFERHGRGLSDPAWVTLRAPTGNEVRFRFGEQRALAQPQNVRSSVVSITDGLCRMGPVTASEAQDIWVALCSMAHIAAEQDEVQEFRDHLDSFLAVTEPDDRFSFEPGAIVWDALVAVQTRPKFERRHAVLMVTESDEQRWTRRPLRLIDARTGVQRVRVIELATYLRHVIGIQLGHGILDGRMSEIGAVRESFERRGTASRTHVHFSLYRLPKEAESEPEELFGVHPIPTEDRMDAQ